MSAEVDELVSPVASLAAASVGVARNARLEAESALAASGEGDGEDELDDERRGAVSSGAGGTTWEAGFVRPGGGGACPCVAVRDACSPWPEAPVFLVDLVLVAISSVLNVAFAVPTAALTLVARSLALALGVSAACTATATAGAAEAAAGPDPSGVAAPELSSGCVTVLVAFVATVDDDLDGCGHRG